MIPLIEDQALLKRIHRTQCAFRAARWTHGKKEGFFPLCEFVRLAEPLETMWCGVFLLDGELVDTWPLPDATSME